MQVRKVNDFQVPCMPPLARGGASHESRGRCSIPILRSESRSLWGRASNARVIVPSNSPQRTEKIYLRREAFGQ